MKKPDPAAGISSETAVTAVGNRYDLVLIAARRVRELHRGYRSMVSTGHGPLVTAQLEIEQGLVGRDYLLKDQDMQVKRGSRQKF